MRDLVLGVIFEMRVCFTTKPGEFGGPSVLVKNLSRFLLESGIEITFEVDERYDILFVVVEAPIDLVRKKKKEGVKVLQQLNGLYFGDVKHWNIGPASVYKEADLIIFLSKFSKDIWEKNYGLPKSPWRIIYNPVDTDRFTPYGERVDFGYRHAILAVACWKPFRRLHDLILAFESLLKIRDDTCFIIIGPGVEQRGETKHIKVLGPIENRYLPKYYRGADVFVHATWIDASPHVVLESLSSGVPVVCTDLGGTHELVGKGGIILKTGLEGYDPEYLYEYGERMILDSDQFAAAINRLIENKTYYGRLARNRAITNFSCEVIGRQYLQVFEELME